MSSEHPVEVSNPESQVFVVPCNPGDARQKWLHKDAGVISKVSRKCIAANAVSSYSIDCYSLKLVECNAFGLDQQWTHLSKDSASSRDFYNARYNIELSMDFINSSQVYACSQ